MGLLRLKPRAHPIRAEFAALLVRGIGLYDKEPAGSFKDVTESDWYRTDVLIANREGLVTGYDGKYYPNRFITRQERLRT